MKDSIRYREIFTASSGALWLLSLGLLALLLTLVGSIGVGNLHIVLWEAAIAAALMLLVIVLRQDALAAGIVVAISVILDWYVGFHIAAPATALCLLVAFFLTRSPQRPWVTPPALWLWGLFLLLTLGPAFRGANTGYDTLAYYPNLILGALIVFWLGNVIARDRSSIVCFFNIISLFSSLIALHIIVEALTGRLFFTTPNVDVFLASTSYYQLGDTGVSRLGSFFIQPDEASAFLAMLCFIPLGLFMESASLPRKLFYILEVLLMLVALLFTYSTGAWLAAGVGIVVLVLLAGSLRHSLQVFLGILITSTIVAVSFSSQFTLLVAHSILASDLIGRQALWATALRVIAAFPLTGVGLSRLTYLIRSDPFRVPEQLAPINNPHNSYLEWAAMGGIPVLCVFLALLIFALWKALCNWKQADTPMRPLLAAGIAAIIALSVNSWSFGLWTLAPLAIPGWLLLGVVASPLVARIQTRSGLNHTTPHSTLEI